MIETYDDLFVKNCLRCGSPTPENREEDDIYCETCGSPLLNECTNDHCRNKLNPTAVYCRKCGCISSFASNGLIENKYPKAEIVTPLTGDDIPF